MLIARQPGDLLDFVTGAGNGGSCGLSGLHSLMCLNRFFDDSGALWHRGRRCIRLQLHRQKLMSRTTRSNSFTCVSQNRSMLWFHVVQGRKHRLADVCCIDSILSAAHSTLGYLSIGTLFQNSLVPSLKAGFSWSSSQRSIISNSATVSASNGSTRNVICGLFSCRSRNRVTKLWCRFSTSVADLAVCLFRVVLVTCLLAFSEMGKCAKSPFWICVWNSFSCLTKANTLCRGSGSIFKLPCRVKFSLSKWHSMSTKKARSIIQLGSESSGESLSFSSVNSFTASKGSKKGESISPFDSHLTVQGLEALGPAQQRASWIACG